MKSVATHLPENVSWFDASGSVDVEDDIFDNKLFRPSLMLESPELLEVLKFSDGGVPQHWRWRGIETKCILSDGPEVISEAWWQGFGNPRGRFYFRVQDASGCWLWIFWTQTNGSNLIEDGLWYLHGWWA